MRSSVVAALLLCACGGNYSNADVEFAAAVPRRGDVTTNLPKTHGLRASSSGLRNPYSAPSSQLGEASSAYQNTRSTGAMVDGMAEFFISVLELAQSYDPTVRTPEVRIWGPWADEKSPGWELQLAIARQPVTVPGGSGDPVEGFYWQIQYRPQGQPAFLPDPLVDGLFEPGDIRRGRGVVVAHFAEYRASGMPSQQTLDELGTLAEMELGYDTRTGQPHTVTVQMTSDSSATATIGYQELDTGAGQLGFQLSEAAPSTNVLSMLARWQADTSGRGDAVVQSGAAAGQLAVECWDASHGIVYLSKPWELIFDGSEASCAFGPP